MEKQDVLDNLRLELAELLTRAEMIGDVSLDTRVNLIQCRIALYQLGVMTQ